MTKEKIKKIFIAILLVIFFTLPSILVYINNWKNDPYKFLNYLEPLTIPKTSNETSTTTTKIAEQSPIKEPQQNNNKQIAELQNLIINLKNKITQKDKDINILLSKSPEIKIITKEIIKEIIKEVPIETERVVEKPIYVDKSQISFIKITKETLPPTTYNFFQLAKPFTVFSMKPQYEPFELERLHLTSE